MEYFKTTFLAFLERRVRDSHHLPRGLLGEVAHAAGDQLLNTGTHNEHCSSSTESLQLDYCVNLLCKHVTVGLQHLEYDESVWLRVADARDDLWEGCQELIGAYLVQMIHHRPANNR